MNTNDVNIVIDWIVHTTKQIEELPLAALTVLACVAFGYALKRIPKYPDQWIPAGVIAFGIAVMVLLAGPHPDAMTAFAWRFRKAVIGLVVAVTAWGAHYLLLNKLEDNFPLFKRLVSGQDTNQQPKDNT